MCTLINLGILYKCIYVNPASLGGPKCPLLLIFLISSYFRAYNSSKILNKSLMYTRISILVIVNIKK